MDYCLDEFELKLEWSVAAEAAIMLALPLPMIYLDFFEAVRGFYVGPPPFLLPTVTGWALFD